MMEASEDSSISDQADPQEQQKITVSVKHTNEQCNSMSETPLNATLDHEMEGEVMNLKYFMLF